MKIKRNKSKSMRIEDIVWSHMSTDAIVFGATAAKHYQSVHCERQRRKWQSFGFSGWPATQTNAQKSGCVVAKHPKRAGAYTAQKKYNELTLLVSSFPHYSRPALADLVDWFPRTHKHCICTQPLTIRHRYLFTALFHSGVLGASFQSACRVLLVLFLHRYLFLRSQKLTRDDGWTRNNKFSKLSKVELFTH